MKKYIWQNLLVLLLTGCTPGKRGSIQNPVYTPEVEERIQRVINNLQVETAFPDVYESKSLSDQMVHYHTPGVSIAVINNGRIEWARGFGARSENTLDSVNVHTLFEAGSVSKPIFALTVMRLRERGILDLDKDVNEYLTSWKIPANAGWQPVVTLRQLLSHTAGTTVHGFPGYLITESVPTIPQLLNGESPANTSPVKVNIMPGTAFRYSGGGTTVAMLTVMDVIKKPFPSIVEDELFGPMKLPHSTYSQPLPDSLADLASTAFPYKGQPIKGRFHVYPEMSAAGLWTNPTELATLAIEVQRALRGESALLNKETAEEMLTPQKVAKHIGIGFFLEGKGDSARFRHGGWDEGFVTEFIAYKKLGMGAVIMVNSNEGYELLNEISKAIAIEYQWPGFLPEKNLEADVTPEEIKKHPGTYADPDSNEYKIEGLANALHLSYQNQSPVLLSKRKDGVFFSHQLNFTVQFENGTLKFTQMGNTVTCKKR